MILFCLIAGCSRTSPEPASVEEAPAATPARQAHANAVAVALYTDAEIRSLAKFDIAKESRRDPGIFKIPCLDVVPAGESHARAEVFKKLNIDEKRVTEFRQRGEDFVVFLTWRVSPSYDICCMTAVNDRENDGLQMTDPRRKVYGIRLLKRSE